VARVQQGVRLPRADAGFCADERIPCPLPASGSSGYTSPRIGIADMEVVASSSVVRSGTARTRSRVTNGRSPFVETDGRGQWARRWRDVLGEIVGDLGGADLLSEGQRQLARRAATIAIACEKLEGEAAAGNDINLETYGQLTDRLGRCFQRLGLKRQPRDVSPSLSDLLRQDMFEQRAVEAAARVAEASEGYPEAAGDETRTSGLPNGRHGHPGDEGAAP
jgi:hypothetical protein